MNFKPILVSSTANINNHLIPGNFIVNKEDKTISVVLQDNSLLNVGKIDDVELQRLVENAAQNIPTIRGDDGKDGVNGVDGVNGQDGQDGEDGATFTPIMTQVDGNTINLSWSNNKNLANPAVFNVNGEKGDKGDKGERGESAVVGMNFRGKYSAAETYAIGDFVICDNEEIYISNEEGLIGVDPIQSVTDADNKWLKLSIRGAAGQDGKDGKDGFDGSNFDDSQIQAELLTLKDADIALENRIKAIKAPTIIQNDTELDNFTEAGSFVINTVTGTAYIKLIDGTWLKFKTALKDAVVGGVDISIHPDNRVKFLDDGLFCSAITVDDLELLDLSQYPSAQQVQEFNEHLKLEDYVKRKELDVIDLQNYLTRDEVQEFKDVINTDDFVRRSELDVIDLQNYLTKDEVQEFKDAINTDDYVKRSELDVVDLSTLPTKDQIDEFNENLKLDNYVKRPELDVLDLSNFPTKDEIAEFREITILDDYVKRPELTKLDLSKFPDQDQINEFNENLKLDDYVKRKELSELNLDDYITRDELTGIIGGGSIDLSLYLKIADAEATYLKKTDQVKVDLSQYSTTAEIEAAYAKKTDLDVLATKTELGDYLSKTDAETTYAKKTDLDSVAVDVSQEQGNKLIEKPDGLFFSAVTPDELTTSLAEYVRKDETGGLGGITAEYIADSKTLRLTGIKF